MATVNETETNAQDRITVQITPDLHKSLKALAAEKSEGKVSPLVRQALKEYLGKEENNNADKNN